MKNEELEEIYNEFMNNLLDCEIVVLATCHPIDEQKTEKVWEAIKYMVERKEE